MMETNSYIGDKGVIKRTDSFGMAVIFGSSIVSIVLIALGIAAFL